MAFDAHKNFAYSTVATAPSPAGSGTSLIVQTGDGAKFPATPFNATVWPVGTQPLTSNAEIVRVTGITGDTFTITRTQESTAARSILIGDQIANTITAKVLTDVESASGGDTLNTVASSGSSQTINFGTANVWDITLTANCTFTFSGFTSGPKYLTLILRQDGTGSRTVTWPTTTWLAGAAPFLHTAPSSIDVITIFSDDSGATYIGSVASSPYTSGYEFGYDQVTTNVTVSSATESSGTTVISCAAHSFDGAPVLATFFCPRATLASNDQILVSLFEGSTQIGRLALFTAGAAATPNSPITGMLRFTPTAASHTYTVTATRASSNGTLNCGSGGTSTEVPMFIRFTKV